MADSEDTGMRPRTLEPGQRTCVWIASTTSATPTLLLETSEILFEAPNWSLDGTHLLLNGDGRLWRLDVEGGVPPVEVPLHGVPAINNDHVLSPDGATVYVSGMDGHLYSAPATGGQGRRLTEEDGTLHFLHGISPDGRTLAYVSIDRSVEGAPGRLALMPAAGGPGTLVDTGEGHIDGPEYSPDGRFVYLNSEAFTTAPGHAQLARLAADGGQAERVLASETVDWFPHLSPDGTLATYVAFPAGTLGHPENLDVTVHLVAVDDWSRPLHSFPLFGGQGTLNVNSWAPDSRRFAFVSYPVEDGVR
ncbi:TolB family protein [Streptomyces sp. NPDC059740]|uniref:TolB family protein n=1 Tax=Streptomyces sp. NPDC059740 TaxID=3346926 RepID=UPI00364A5402